MFAKKPTIIGQPQQFVLPAMAPLARRRPASPGFVQTLMESLVSLNEKVDTLTRTAQRSQETAPVESPRIRAKPVVSREVQVRPHSSESPAEDSAAKLNRRRLLEFFD